MTGSTIGDRPSSWLWELERSANNAQAMEGLIRTATFAGMASYIRFHRDWNDSISPDDEACKY